MIAKKARLIIFIFALLAKSLAFSSPSDTRLLKKVSRHMLTARQCFQDDNVIMFTVHVGYALEILFRINSVDSYLYVFEYLDADEFETLKSEGVHLLDPSVRLRFMIYHRPKLPWLYLSLAGSDDATG